MEWKNDEKAGPKLWYKWYWKKMLPGENSGGQAVGGSVGPLDQLLGRGELENRLN